MKLIDFKVYTADDNVPGWCIDIFKFRRKSLIELSCDKAVYQSLPSFLIQLGPSDVLYLSLGLLKYIVSISIWARHYDD